MKTAILSDIHSNHLALKAVLRDVQAAGIERLIVLGDIFGYYPWAVETYDLLKPYLNTSYFIKGNHDQLLLDHEAPSPEPSYWEAAKLNEADLRSRRPEAFAWLLKLENHGRLELDGLSVTLQHGTPDDANTGRFYPDNENTYAWFPKAGEALLMGHTHYPILRRTAAGGWLFNPGSVGQPRDGNPMPAWGIYDADTKQFSLHRTAYNQVEAMEMLSAMNWNARAIQALNKTNKGSL